MRRKVWQVKITELSTTDVDFKDRLDQLLSRGSEFDPEIESRVREIVQRVRNEGDQALLEYAHTLDGSTAEIGSDLEISRRAMQQATDRIESDVNDAIVHAAARISSFHQRQLESSWEFTDDFGTVLGQRVTPIRRVGIYVPGGQASYPSSVLMTAIPARVAGVEEIIITTPAKDGAVNDIVLAAALEAGVDRVFAVGGAQAVAAMAFGTATIPKVDKIVGPGNVWVSSAKRQVFGHVGIDLIAGPSEVVVVCDDTTDAEWAAMDMFAQAEHDEDAQSILISASAVKIAEVKAAMQRLLPAMERRNIISAALERQGALICVESWAQLAKVVNRIAPEHLELLVNEPLELSQQMQNAGAIFLGSYSAEVLGDYCAGPSHVLPTSGAARFSSPLGVYDFQKRTSIIQCSENGAQPLAETARVLAREERLTAHMRSAEYRLKQT